MSNEKIGKHKGALRTLMHEKKELSRLLQIVDSQMQRHMQALEQEGVDSEQYMNQLAEADQKKQQQQQQQRQQNQQSQQNQQRRSQGQQKRQNRQNQQNQKRQRKQNSQKQSQRQSKDNVGGMLEDDSEDEEERDFNPL